MNYKKIVILITSITTLILLLGFVFADSKMINEQPNYHVKRVDTPSCNSQLNKGIILEDADLKGKKPFGALCYWLDFR